MSPAGLLSVKLEAVMLVPSIARENVAVTVELGETAETPARGCVAVTDGGLPVPRLNELDYVKGQVYANVWQTNLIARISPDTGRVLGWIDCTGLLSAAEAADVAQAGGVLNGIAYDAAHDRLFVTGKLWPKVFEIKVR